MKKFNYTIFSFAVCGLIGLASCKKEKQKTAPDVFYNVTIEGFKVTFDNQTKGAVSYTWDFGDGTSSTDESPSHTYTHKGKFVPTLTATAKDGATADASTVLYISKSSPVKMDDNTLSDWDTITHNVVLEGPDAGNFIKAKYDYDGNNVYFYFEQKAAKSDQVIYDLYIDADNDPATGYTTGDIPNGGYEVLLEGTIFDDWLDVYYHSGDQASFDGYAPQSLNEFYETGTVKESNGVLKFEGALKRNKIKGFTGQGLRIGIQVFTNDFNALIGYSPDLGSNSFFLDMSE